MYFDYDEGQYAFKTGRAEINFNGGPHKTARGEFKPEGGPFMAAEISAADMREILEGRLSVVDANASMKLHMLTSGCVQDFTTRPYFSLWASITKIGQEIVTAEKLKTYNKFS